MVSHNSTRVTGAMEDKMVVIPQQLDRSYHSSYPQFLDSFAGKGLDDVAKVVFG